MPFDHRGKRADEQLELFRAFFADDAPQLRAASSTTCPRSASSPSRRTGRVPIWVGGDTEPAFRRVARVRRRLPRRLPAARRRSRRAWAPRRRARRPRPGRDRRGAAVDPPLPRSRGLDAGGEVDRRVAGGDGRHDRRMAGDRRRPHPPRPRRARAGSPAGGRRWSASCSTSPRSSEPPRTAPTVSRGRRRSAARWAANQARRRSNFAIPPVAATICWNASLPSSSRRWRNCAAALDTRRRERRGTRLARGGRP